MGYDLFVIAGEPSGDEHAALVLNQLHKQAPELKIAAVSGPAMKRAFPHFEILNIQTLSVMGFIDILKCLPRLFKAYRTILKCILAHNPPAVLFVDYPGMNLKLAQKLRQKGYKGALYHFIAPTAWAWKSKRTELLRKSNTQLFCILPFEEAFFKQKGVDATYVGHPLMQKLESYFHQDKPNRPILALFPGSRSHEIKKNLPLMLQGAQDFIHKHPEFSLSLSVASPHLFPLIQSHLINHPLKKIITLVEGSKTISLMRQAQFAIAKSGTCNLELALLGTPSVIVYAISKLDLWIARHLFKINLPYYSLPNLLLKKEMFKELFGPFFTQKNLNKSLDELTSHLQEVEQDSQTLKTLLGTQNPGQAVADTLLQKIFYHRQHS